MKSVVYGKLSTLSVRIYRIYTRNTKETGKNMLEA
jgi:hypothetical protein